MNHAFGLAALLATLVLPAVTNPGAMSGRASVLQVRAEFSLSGEGIADGSGETTSSPALETATVPAVVRALSPMSAPSPMSASKESPAVERPVDTTALPTWSIRGTVTSNGVGIAWVIVTLAGTSTSTTVQTDASGNYAFADVADGNYTVSAILKSYKLTPASQAVTVSGGDRVGVNFTAAPNRSAIRGTVTSAYGYSGMAVALAGSALTATIDAAGNYTFTDVPDGSYAVRPSRAGYSFTPAEMAVSVRGVDLAGVNFTLTQVSYSLSGTVMTADGVGKAGAIVTLRGASVAARNSTADASGNYAFTGLVDGTYSLTPYLPGFAFAPAMQSAVVSGANKGGVNLIAVPAWSLKGTVTFGGVGKGGVIVALAGTPTRTVATDASGNYAYTGVADGNYTVSITSGQQPAGLNGYTYSPASQTAAVSGADRLGVNFTAEPTTYSIGGTVTSAYGYSGMTVALTGAATQTASTDASGNYRFTGLAAGNYTVAPSRAGYSFSPASRAVAVSLADQLGANFAVISPYSIKGQVTAGGVGQVVNMTLQGAGTRYVNSDVKGYYTFANVPDGSYTVTPSLVGGPPFTPASQAVTVSGGDQVGVNFTTLPTYALGGTIISGGVGKSGVPVALSGGATAKTYTDASGNYTFYQLVDGSYTVTPNVSFGPFTPPGQTAVISKANTYGVNFVGVQAYSLRGTVTVNGVGKAGVSISVRQGTAWKTATTDASGNYSVPGLVDGSYLVSAGMAGYEFIAAGQTAYVNTQTAVVSGTDKVGVNFVDVHPLSGSVTVTVVNQVVGVYQAGVTVRGPVTRTALTDAAGNYSVAGLPNGSYTVTPSQTGNTFLPPSQLATVSGASKLGVNFSVVPISSISGIVTSNGVVKAGVTVVLTGAATQTTTTDAAGTYTFRGLANGSYVITPSLASYTFTPASRSVITYGSIIRGYDFTASP